MRARKEGGARWNEDEQKHFVKNFDDEDGDLDMRQGFEPGQIPAPSDSNFAIDDDDKDDQSSDHNGETHVKKSMQYGDDLDDRNVWNQA